MVKYVHRLPTIWFDTALARSVASPSEKGRLNTIYVNIGSNIFHLKVFVCQKSKSVMLHFMSKAAWIQT